MSDEFTPGPWAAIEWSCHPSTTIKAGKPGNRVVAECATAWNNQNGRDVANARLIAAAPDLLALARQYASECGECNGDGTIEVGENIDKAAGMVPERQPCADCADIRAVIAKAVTQ